MILLVLNEEATYIQMLDWHEVVTRPLTFHEANKAVEWCESANSQIGVNRLMEQIHLHKENFLTSLYDIIYEITYRVKIEDVNDAVIFKMKWG